MGECLIYPITEWQYMQADMGISTARGAIHCLFCPKMWYEKQCERKRGRHGMKAVGISGSARKGGNTAP